MQCFPKWTAAPTKVVGNLKGGTSSELGDWGRSTRLIQSEIVTNALHTCSESFRTNQS